MSIPARYKNGSWQFEADRKETVFTAGRRLWPCIVTFLALAVYMPDLITLQRNLSLQSVSLSSMLSANDNLKPAKKKKSMQELKYLK